MAIFVGSSGLLSGLEGQKDSIQLVIGEVPFDNQK